MTQPSHDSPLVSVRNLSFSYGHAMILEDINLEIREGEFIGIVGPNAGGKSTLLKLMLGLLKPGSGSIHILGKSSEKVRCAMGYVPQYPAFSRDFPITVEEAVILGLLGKTSLWGFYTSKARNRVRQAMQETEVESLASQQLSTLSGGQLQRVLLARALVGDPRILFLDEPTANIDMRLETDIFDLLRDLNQRMTIVVVSHDVGFISAYVSRVACINKSLICHETSMIDGQIISDLYGSHVHMVEHTHGEPG